MKIEMTSANKMYISEFFILVIGGIISWISRNQPVPPLDPTNPALNFHNMLIVQNTTYLGLGATMVALGVSLLIIARLFQISTISPNEVAS